MRVLTSFILVMLMGTMLIGWLTLSADAEMMGSTNDCLFMNHESGLCPMDLFDHIKAWQSVFIAVPTTLYFFVILLGAIVGLVTVNPFWRQLLTRSIPIILSSPPDVTGPSVSRSWQELFARGILHPKLFSLVN